MEVDNEECFGGADFLAAFVFLALDAAVAAGEFGSEGLGDVVQVPGVVKQAVGGCVVSWCVMRGEREKGDDEKCCNDECSFE